MNFVNFFDYVEKNLFTLSAKQKYLLEKYYYFLKEYNESINLTAKTDLSIILERHFLDCAYACKYVNFENALIADIGSGAGFPGMIIKILTNNCEIYLFESIKKKAEFLNKLSQHLEIKVNIIPDRVENYHNKMQKKFDIITARAVTNFKIISKFAYPILKKQGLLCLMKGPNFFNELKEFPQWKNQYLLKENNEYILPISLNKLAIWKFKKIH